MLSGEKILVTGAAGLIGGDMCRYLCRENEVWGLARFSNPAERTALEAMGVRTYAADLADGNFEGLPRDFTYLAHNAMSLEPRDYDIAMRVNAEGTGNILSHCRTVKAALSMSTVSVYKPHPDPWHRYAESDPLGDTMGATAPYSVTKIAQEGVARFCAREFGMPVIIARMGAAYSARGGLPIMHLKSAMAGDPIRTRWDPCAYSPIHTDDINEQLEAMFAAASVPATITNWCGDEAVSVQQWAAMAGNLLGREVPVEVKEVPGASHGACGDTTRALSLVGPCRVSFADGFARTFRELEQAAQG